MVWTAIIYLVAAIIIAYAITPSAPEQRPQQLDQGSIPIAKEGVPIPVIFGTVRIMSPNCVWYGDIAYKPVKTKSGK